MRIGRLNVAALVIIDGDGVVDAAAGSGGEFSADPDRVFAVWDRFTEWAGRARRSRRAHRPAGARRSSARRCWPRPRCSGSD